MGIWTLSSGEWKGDLGLSWFINFISFDIPRIYWNLFDLERNDLQVDSTVRLDIPTIWYYVCVCVLNSRSASHHRFQYEKYGVYIDLEDIGGEPSDRKLPYHTIQNLDHLEGTRLEAFAVGSWGLLLRNWWLYQYLLSINGSVHIIYGPFMGIDHLYKAISSVWPTQCLVNGQRMMSDQIVNG